MTLIDHEPSALQALARPADAEYQVNFPKRSGYRVFRVWKLSDKDLCVYAEEGVSPKGCVPIVTGQASFKAKVTRRRVLKVNEFHHDVPVSECFGRADDGFTTRRALIERFLQFLARDQRFLEHDDAYSLAMPALGHEDALYLNQHGEQWLEELGGTNGPQPRTHITRHW